MAPKLCHVETAEPETADPAEMQRHNEGPDEVSCPLAQKHSSAKLRKQKITEVFRRIRVVYAKGIITKTVI